MASRKKTASVQSPAMGPFLLASRAITVKRQHSPREGLMANKFQGTWYVSFERPRGKRTSARATEPFPNEREAKEFATTKLVETLNVTAGTLNPHLPKRTIAATQIVHWLEQADEPDASN
jgi:hypothetical protein